MKRKKTAALIAAAFLAFSVSACSGTQNDSSIEDNTVTEKTAETDDSTVSAVNDEMPSLDMPEHVEYSSDIPAPSFSMDTGFYEEDSVLRLSCPDGYTIRYTTDGSVPTGKSEEYSKDLLLTHRSSHPNLLSSLSGIGPEDSYYVPDRKINKGTVVRAACFDSDGKSGPVITNTYFIGLDQNTNYNSLPVISLSTDAGNLFNYEYGIYTAGKTYDEWKNTTEATEADPWNYKGNYTQKGREWERPVHMELIEPEGKVMLEQDLGMRIMGKATRTYNQKSFRMYAREEYGSKKIEYSLIPGAVCEGNSDKPLDEFKTFLLRNSGNDCDYAKVRDPFIQETVSGLSMATQSSRPAIVFINGEYWGVYAIEEDYSDSSIHYDYGVDRKNVVMIKRGVLEEGEESDMALYDELCASFSRDLSDPEAYAELCEKTDIKNIADYYSVLVYTANEDCIFAGNNNWRIWRARTVSDEPYQDGKWRFMLYDTEFSLGLYKNGETARQDTLTIAEESEWFGALMKNDDFKKLFTESLRNTAELFRPENSLPVLERLTDEYGPVAAECFMRFGPQWVGGSGLTSINQHYEYNIESVKKFLADRYDYITGLPALR